MRSGTPRHLFVYGTLRPGEASPLADEVARHTRPAGPASIAARLYDLGPYPAAVPALDPGDRVHGHLLRLEDSGGSAFLEALDRYEGCPASGVPVPLFVRREVEARTEAGLLVSAWTWFYARDPAGASCVKDGCWRRRARD